MRVAFALGVAQSQQARRLENIPEKECAGEMAGPSQQAECLERDFSTTIGDHAEASI
jgi:hypothetical protein